MSFADERVAELAKRLAGVRERIDDACAAAGRDSSEVTLIAVTKTYPASDVLALASLGLTDFGENRDQEAAPKAADVAAAGVRARWHFIGQLQTNKARHVAGYADVVHSVDRVRLARALGAAARAAGRELTCLVQVNLAAENVPGAATASTPARGSRVEPQPQRGGRRGFGAASPQGGDGGTESSHDLGGPRGDHSPGGNTARGGAARAMVAEVAEAIEAEQGLALGGLMAVAPRFADPAAAFASLRDLSALVRSVNPSGTVISAGMSGDLEAAIANGATHLRIGTALLGDRSLPVL